jgi:hypothetical protein
MCKAGSSCLEEVGNVNNFWMNAIKDHALILGHESFYYLNNLRYSELLCTGL